MTSYLGLWFTGCLARHSVRVIQVDSSTRLLRERLASRLCVLCSLYLATSVVRGTAWLPQDFSAYCCQYYTKSVFTTSVVAAAVCGQVDSTHRLQFGFGAKAEVQQVQGRGSQPELTESGEFG